MNLIYDMDVIYPWARERLPDFDPDRSTAIGVMDGDELIAAAVFFNFKGHDVEIGFAADDPRWARRDVIRGIFHYIFEQLGCIRLTTITGEHNARARKLDEGLGFKQEGYHPRGMGPDEAAISYGMMKEDCKWL